MATHKLLAWCRHHWVVTIVLGFLALCILLLGIGLVAEDDHKERVRVSVALGQAATIRNAALEHFEKTKQLPANLSSFIAEPRYARENKSGESDMPGRVAFSQKSDGRLLLITFDSDQGALAGQTLILELQAENETIRWKCSSTQIRDRYLPSMCRSGAGAQAR